AGQSVMIGVLSSCAIWPSGSGRRRVARRPSQSMSFRTRSLNALMPTDDDIDVKAARREFLAGAFLEKKSATTYYFPHRSFAEFLVAEYMTLHPPSGHGHQLYSRISTDGVIAFLQDAPLEAGAGTWTQTLAGAAGLVSVEYLAFLFEMARKRGGTIELP